MKDVSEREFAKVVDASLSTVQDRRKAGLLPKSAKQDAKGRWRIDPEVGLEEWHENAPLRASSDVDTEALRAWREARARRETALAAQAEDDLRRRRAELVEATEVEAKLVTVFSQVRTKLLGVPSKVRQQDPALTASQLALLDNLIREALEDLAAGADDGNEG